MIRKFAVLAFSALLACAALASCGTSGAEDTYAAQSAAPAPLVPGAGIHAVLTDDDGPAAVPETGAIADIKLNYRTVILAPEKKFTLSASGASDADAIVWTSSDESVVRVEDGVVTAVGPGLARVYAIDVNGKSASCAFEIKPAEVESVTLDRTAAALKAGESLALSPAVLPAAASDMTLQWTSSDASVVRVEDGVVTALRSGSATVTAASPNGKKASCKITVTAAGVESVALNYRTVLLDAGKTFRLTATVTPADAENAEVAWTSSDTSVVRVENGVVTAVGAGKAVVTASTANGKSASCQLEVRGASSSSLKLSSKELSLTAGNSALLTANAAVSWSSSDPSVAAVTSGGRVEAKKPGSAAITARAADGSTATCTVFVSAGNTAGDVQSILNSAPLNPTRTGVAAVDELVDRIFDEIFTPGMTTYEKTRAIYDYLVDNITYGRGSKYWTDYISLLGGRTYSSRDREVILRAYDILISDVGVCNDYSAAFMVMTRAVGLECFYVEGKTNNISGGYSGHIWNNIRINGTLYTFDVQVEANITDRAGGVNTYTRFCKTDAQMGSRLIYFRRQADIDAYNGFRVLS